jgi:hypothetical protein
VAAKVNFSLFTFLFSLIFYIFALSYEKDCIIIRGIPDAQRQRRTA